MTELPAALRYLLELALDEAASHADRLESIYDLSISDARDSAQVLGAFATIAVKSVSDTGLRLAALRAMARVDDDSCNGVLLQIFGNRDELSDIRELAGEMIAKRGARLDETSISDIRSVLRDKDETESIRRRALSAVSKSDQGLPVDEYVGMFKRETGEIKEQLLLILLGSADARALVTIIDDARVSPVFRKRALEKLITTDAESSYDSFRRAISDSPAIAAAAFSAILRYASPPQRVDLLTRLARDRELNLQERVRAATELRFLSDTKAGYGSALKGLQGLTLDDSLPIQLRIAAGGGLGKQAIANLIDDPSQPLQLRVGLYLSGEERSQLGLPRVIQLLSEVVRSSDTSDGDRLRYLSALAAVSRPATCVCALKAVADSGLDVASRADVALFLRDFESGSVRRGLEEISRDGAVHSEIRCAALISLVSRGGIETSREAINRLIDLVRAHSGSADCFMRARDCSKRLYDAILVLPTPSQGEHDVVSRLRRCSEDESEPKMFRRIAASVVGKWDSERAEPDVIEYDPVDSAVFDPKRIELTLHEDVSPIAILDIVSAVLEIHEVVTGIQMSDPVIRIGFPGRKSITAGSPAADLP